MNFQEKRKQQTGIVFASERIGGQRTVSNDPKTMVKGIRFFKGLHIQPKRGDFIGLLAGTGVGKSTVANIIAKDTLLNNDGYVVIISLEMTVDEVLERFEVMCEDCPEILQRLIIIDCYNEDGSNKGLSVSDVKLELKKIKSVLNGVITLTLVDHFHEINNNGSVDYNPIAKELKNLFIEVDTLGLVLSQTTKEKGLGDVPVPRNGCFGCSRFENLCSFMLTIFQPLRRVQNECNLPALGWQLCKIRNKKNKLDKVREEINYVLKYDSETEDLTELNMTEITEFQMYYEKVLELRSAEEKRKSYQFDLSTTIKGKDGREVKLTKIFGGESSDE